MARQISMRTNSHNRRSSINQEKLKKTQQSLRTRRSRTVLWGLWTTDEPTKRGGGAKLDKKNAEQFPKGPEGAHESRSEETLWTRACGRLWKGGLSRKGEERRRGTRPEKKKNDEKEGGGAPNARAKLPPRRRRRRTPRRLEGPTKLDSLEWARDTDVCM